MNATTPCPHLFPFVLTTTEAARLGKKHGKVMGCLRRVISMLPPEFSRKHFIKMHADKRQVYKISLPASIFLFMPNATKIEILGAMHIVNEICALNNIYTSVITDDFAIQRPICSICIGHGSVCQKEQQSSAEKIEVSCD